MAIDVWWKNNDSWSWLSNLAKRPFIFSFEGYEYIFYSVEHAYQTLKSGIVDFDLYENPEWEDGGVKLTGSRKAYTKHNWNVELMEYLIYESFRQNFDKALDLIATGEEEFTHTKDKGIWKEKFPYLLTKARSVLNFEITSRFQIIPK